MSVWPGDPSQCVENPRHGRTSQINIPLRPFRSGQYRNTPIQTSNGSTRQNPSTVLLVQQRRGPRPSILRCPNRSYTRKTVKRRRSTLSPLPSGVREFGKVICEDKQHAEGAQRKRIVEMRLAKDYVGRTHCLLVQDEDDDD